VQAGGGHANDHISRTDAVRPQELVSFNHAGGCAGDVVLVLAQQAGCSAVSPPTSAVPATEQAAAMPRTISAMRSGTTLPQAM
jgi:hypothetical protein